MKRSIRLLYCILGSIILSLASTPISYEALSVFPIIGFVLSQLTYLISSIGIILTIYFAVMLIKENWKLKDEWA